MQTLSPLNAQITEVLLTGLAKPFKSNPLEYQLKNHLDELITQFNQTHSKEQLIRPMCRVEKTRRPYLFSFAPGSIKRGRI